MGELRRVRQLPRTLLGWLIHVNGKIAKRPARALCFQRTGTASFARPDVGLGAVPLVTAAVVQKLACGTAPRQMHAQFLHQLAFARDAVEIPDQEDPQKWLRIDRRATVLTVADLQSLAHKLKADVLLDVVFGNLIFQTEVLEQRLRAVMASHHEQQASENGNPAKHE
jgi:hypothetical protein